VQRARLAAAGPGPAQQAGRPPTAVRSRWWRTFPITPFRVVVAYVVVGLLWIAFSDQALRLLIPDPALRDELQTLKGAFFVLATAALVFELVRRGQRGLVRFGTEIRAAVESMVDGVVVADASGLVEANRAAVELLGAAGKEQLLGSLEAFGERFQPRRADGVPIPVAELATARALRGERSTAEVVLRRGDGKDVVLSLAAGPIVSPGSPGMAITVMRDVSSAHRLEAMRDEFLATAAHELKTPLAVVKAYAQLVQRRTPAEAPALTVVQRQVDRMTRLVQHLLDASRLRLDTGGLAQAPFDLSGVAAEVVERVRSGVTGHALSLQAPARLPVQGDRDRVVRVVLSLVDNAVRFSPQGGPVEVRVETAGGEAVVSVTDHGLGIPMERQARVFERYYRAHAGTTEDYGGLGLSLELSREIVTRHGGRIWFESRPGAGSTFHFSLPLAKEASP
jgi:two-component system, OmpR family, phosphate regulon sensor histidine kinase PhoR